MRPDVLSIRSVLRDELPPGPLEWQISLAEHPTERTGRCGCRDWSVQDCSRERYIVRSPAGPSTSLFQSPCQPRPRAVAGAEGAAISRSEARGDGGTSPLTVNFVWTAGSPTGSQIRRYCSPPLLQEDDHGTVRLPGGTVMKALVTRS